MQNVQTFSNNEIAKFIREAKENAGVNLAREHAASIMAQQETERSLEENTPSDRNMHRAGYI